MSKLLFLMERQPELTDVQYLSCLVWRVELAVKERLVLHIHVLLCVWMCSCVCVCARCSYESRPQASKSGEGRLGESDAAAVHNTGEQRRAAAGIHTQLRPTPKGNTGPDDWSVLVLRGYGCWQILYINKHLGIMASAVCGGNTQACTCVVKHLMIMLM